MERMAWLAVTWLAACAVCAGQDQRAGEARREAMLLRERGPDGGFEYCMESEHAIPPEIEADFERFKARLSEFFVSAGDGNRGGVGTARDGRGVSAISRGRGVLSMVWADWREEPVLSIRGRAQLESRSLIRFTQQRTPGRQEDTHGYCLVEDTLREWSWVEAGGRVEPYTQRMNRVEAADNGRLAVLLGVSNEPRRIVIGEIGDQGGFVESASFTPDEFGERDPAEWVSWVDEGRTLAVGFRRDRDVGRTRFLAEIDGEHGPEWDVQRVVVSAPAGRLRIGSAFSVETQRGVEFKTLTEAGRLVPGLVWRKRDARDRLERVSPSGAYGKCYLGASGRNRGDHFVVSMPWMPGDYEKRIGAPHLHAGWLSWDEPEEAGSGTR